MNLETGQARLFQDVAALTRQANPAEALRVLAAALRAGRLDAAGSEKAGRVVTSIRAAHKEVGVADVRALLLGQCTTSWLANSLVAEAWGRGCALEIHEGEYDNAIQRLMAPPPQVQRPDVVILVPWNRRLLSEGWDRSHQQRAEEELMYWRRCWDFVRERTGGRILQVGYDWVTPGSFGHHLGARPDGDVGLIRQVNEALRVDLPQGSFFLDLEQVSRLVGRERFYDSRRYYLTKQPFSEAGVHSLAAHLWAGIRALMTGPKKVLAVDLDNTLWGGVVGEAGPLGIELGETGDGEAFRSFQRHLRALGRRGILLAICSKNNREDALAPFAQNPHMALALSDFAHVEASWDPKSAGLRRIAETLNVGLDSFVFFDDNPAEREEVRQAVPEVEVVDVPTDPSGYVRALQAGLWFESAEFSTADFQRSDQYQRERQRREALNSFSSMEEYLCSLMMVGSISPVDDSCLHRVAQLVAKTNQFNLTTRRHSLEDVQRLLMSPGSIGLVLNLADKFGDHGLVSVLLAVSEPGMPEKTLRIDTWLMSCRVIGRTAEQFLFNDLLDRARASGCESLLGEYIPTKKNSLVADLFERLNFAEAGKACDGAVTYRLSTRSAIPARTFVVAATDPCSAALEVNGQA
ncbi:MAG TPA: HAD-IIIC family phosphatase [Bryobacteraceae bacterium]|nr:HAD-IIIC family phosphatase [Bryobacteraceae bacterium]